MADQHPYLYLLERRIEDIDAQISLLTVQRDAVATELSRVRVADRFRGIDRGACPASLQRVAEPPPLTAELIRELGRRMMAASDSANRANPTSDPGCIVEPKEENMNPQHQDEARER